MKHKLLFSVLLAAAAAATAVSLYCSARLLTVTNYSIPADVSQPVRVVHLSDLHSAVFGQNSERLVQTVAEQQPDLIVCTGDMLNKTDTEPTVLASLLEQLAQIAPLYCSLGNHEIAWGEAVSADPAAFYEQYGAVVVEQSYVDTEIGGNALRIGGLYGYACPGGFEKDWGSQDWYAEECAFLQDFCDTDSTKLLLCHMPVAWIEYGSLESWDADVVFAGHAHGGQVRLPFIGGLYAPDQGWFPGRECGLYHSSDGLRTLVLSRGLGGKSEHLPRFNNIPEVIVADLVPRSDTSS